MTDQPVQTDQPDEPDEPLTIEDCLALADGYLILADDCQHMEVAQGYAAIAAAFAQNAMAKMAYETHKAWHTSMDEFEVEPQ